MLNFFKKQTNKSHRYHLIVILRMRFINYSHFNGLTELVKKGEYID